MKPYDIDVPQCRAHVERCKTGIFTGSDAQLLKQQVTGMIQSMFGDGPLSAEAGRLRAPVLVTRQGRVPQPRNEQFNAAFDALLTRLDQGFAEIEDYQRRRAANAGVPKSKIRESVLAFFARKPMELQWGTTVLFELGLSDDQALDALHYLEDHGAIEYGGKMQWLHPTDWQWKVQLTTHGRDVADGTLEVSSQLATILVQNFNAPVANAGIAYGDVTQTNTTIPPLPPDVRAKLLETPAGEALVDALDDEQALATPRPEKVRKLAAGVRNLMETTNTVAEFWQHCTEWCGEIATWLGDNAGGFM